MKRRRQQVVPRQRGVSALQQVGRVWMMCLWVYTASGAKRVVVGSWLRGVTGCSLLRGLLAGSSDQGWGHVQGWGSLGVVLLPCNSISRRLFTAQGAVYAPCAQARMLSGLTRVVQSSAALTATDGACQQDTACHHRVTRGLRSVDMPVLLYGENTISQYVCTASSSCLTPAIVCCAVSRCPQHPPEGRWSGGSRYQVRFPTSSRSSSSSGAAAPWQDGSHADSLGPGAQRGAVTRTSSSGVHRCSRRCCSTTRATTRPTTTISKTAAGSIKSRRPPSSSPQHSSHGPSSTTSWAITSCTPSGGRCSSTGWRPEQQERPTPLTR